MKLILLTTIIFVGIFSFTPETKAQELFKSDRMTITKNQSTGEFNFEFILGEIKSGWEFQSMMNKMGFADGGFLRKVNIIAEKCSGDVGQLLMFCSNDSRKLILTDHKGVSFEIVVEGKASSDLNVDKTSRACEFENLIKSFVTVDLHYEGDYITINGQSILVQSKTLKHDQDDERRRISRRFIQEIVADISKRPPTGYCD